MSTPPAEDQPLRRDIASPAHLVIDELLASMSNSQKVLESKRRVFYDAAADQLQCVRSRMAAIDGKKSLALEHAFWCQVFDSLDFEGYKELQTRFLTGKSAAFHRGLLKYLNLFYWLQTKFRLACELGLHESRPLSIIDIGTGPAHFPFVCRHFGHEVFCTDLPMHLPKGCSWEGEHLYDALVNFFQVRRQTHCITRMQKFPRFDRRLQLVTAFMVKFNVDDQGVWGVNEWRFFLRDLAENVLTPDGKAFFQMNKTGRDTSVEYAGNRFFDFMEELGAITDRSSGTVRFNALSTLR